MSCHSTLWQTHSIHCPLASPVHTIASSACERLHCTSTLILVLIFVGHRMCRLVAMSPSVTVDVRQTGNCSTMCCGGEGLVDQKLHRHRKPLIIFLPCNSKYFSLLLSLDQCVQHGLEGTWQNLLVVDAIGKTASSFPSPTTEEEEGCCWGCGRSGGSSIMIVRNYPASDTILLQIFDCVFGVKSTSTGIQ